VNRVTRTRPSRYRDAVDRVETVEELVEVARRIYREDRESHLDDETQIDALFARVEMLAPGIAAILRDR
jgi:hypothetical protein